MNILALDLATETGWAIIADGQKQSGVVTFDVKRGESRGARYLRLNGWLKKKMVEIDHIDVIYHEQAHHRGGAPTEIATGFITHVQTFCAEHNIELLNVHTGTLKKFATGKGNASKAEMIEAAKARGWEPADDNEADAALLLEYALDEIAINSFKRAMFSELALGSLCRYPGTKKLWVKINDDIIAEWDQKKVASRWIGQQICSVAENAGDDIEMEYISR